MRGFQLRVGPIHFEDFDGRDFERLVFAYHVRTEPNYSFEWAGQSGDDGGRDVIGTGIKLQNQDQVFLVACANWAQPTASKANSDLEKYLADGYRTPSVYRFITRGSVSAHTRDAIRAFAISKGVQKVDIWTATDFEENLRARTQSLVLRFVEGEAFPDSMQELAELARKPLLQMDCEVLERMKRGFDRPAFSTPIHQESSLPDFHQAIGDTIALLNTGIYKDREGNLIAQIPSRFDLENDDVKRHLERVVTLLTLLRVYYDESIRSGSIRPCACGDANCEILMIERDVANNKLEQLRLDAITQFNSAVIIACG